MRHAATNDLVREPNASYAYETSDPVLTQRRAKAAMTTANKAITNTESKVDSHAAEPEKGITPPADKAADGPSCT
jgi:hypothetical protein